MEEAKPPICAESNWPSWKFGMKFEDLSTTLHEKYNTTSATIQDPEAFHHDVAEIANRASSYEEFHMMMKKRRAQRLEELEQSFSNVAVKLVANPFILGDEDWASALQFFNTRSFDSVVRFFAHYLPMSDRHCKFSSLSHDTQSVASFPDLSDGDSDTDLESEHDELEDHRVPSHPETSIVLPFHMGKKPANLSIHTRGTDVVCQSAPGEYSTTPSPVRSRPIQKMRVRSVQVRPSVTPVASSGLQEAGSPKSAFSPESLNGPQLKRRRTCDEDEGGSSSSSDDSLDEETQNASMTSDDEIYISPITRRNSKLHTGPWSNSHDSNWLANGKPLPTYTDANESVCLSGPKRNIESLSEAPCPSDTSAPAVRSERTWTRRAEDTIRTNESQLNRNPSHPSSASGNGRKARVWCRAGQVPSNCAISIRPAASVGSRQF